jgi:hypothetical protein
MKLVRSTLNDLVERKLWPVALVLAIALVAVPILIGRGDASVSEPTPPAAVTPTGTTASGTARAAVEVQTTVPTGTTNRAGKVRNPFTQANAPKTTATSTSGEEVTAGGAAPATTEGAATTGSSGSGTSSDSSTTDGSSTDGSTGDGASSTPTTSDPVLEPRSVTLSFGKVTGKQREHADLARLSALPTVDKPLFVYLGVLDDGGTAVFLISESVTATGEGTCRPSPESCKAIELEQGQSAVFDVQEGDATVQYRLDLFDIDPIASTKADVIADAITRHSEAGAKVLRDGHISGDEGFAGTDRYRWLPSKSGLLYRVPATVLAKMVTDGSDAVTLPGEPVWHFELGS